MERWKGVLAAAVLAVSAGGCAATGGERSLEAKQIYADGLCGRTRETPAARWIGGADELEAIRQQFGRYRLGPPTLPEVDFDRYGVLLVLMGKRPTSGYALALPERDAARIADGVARVTLEWRRPAPDALTAQVLTSPCAMVRLPRAGIERIEVYDQSGDQRLSVAP